MGNYDVLRDVSSFAYVYDIDRFGKLQDIKTRKMLKTINTIILHDTTYSPQRMCARSIPYSVKR